MSISLRFFNDPIIAGRIVSVIAGLASLIGLYFIGKTLFNRTVGILAMIFYIAIPFYLIYDGLALMDSLLMAYIIYGTFFTIKLAQTQKPLFAIAAGIVIGLGLLTKSSAIFSLYLLPFGLLLLPKINFQSVVKYCAFSLIAVVFAKAIESFLRLSDYYNVIEGKNHEFIYTLQEVVKDPIKLIIQNSAIIFPWLIDYLGIPLLLLVLFSLFFKKQWKITFFLFAYSVIPLFALILFGKQLYPRYILFMTWPLLLLAGFTIQRFDQWVHRRHMFTFTALIIILAIPLYTDYLLLTNPLKAKLPEIERWQLLNGDPSGFGLNELVNFFNAKKDKRLLIVTDKPLGILPNGLAIHYPLHGNFRIAGADSVTKKKLQTSVRNAATPPDEVYAILTWQENVQEVEATKVLEIKREGKQNHNWRVYKIQNL